MKKFDKEYSTQYTPEKEYLYKVGIKPTFVKVINNVTTYKYEKTPELFKALEFFYAQKDNIQVITWENTSISANTVTLNL